MTEQEMLARMELLEKENERLTDELNSTASERDNLITEKQSLEADLNNYKAQNSVNVLEGKPLPQITPDEQFADLIKNMFKEN